jgi:hypothetical protein
MLLVSIFAMLSAISISGVAAYYSIMGLTTIFPASVFAVIIMGVVLEVGKISSAIWLHTFWNRASFLIKTYLSMAIIILIFITSLGIFGFLSKSHIEHTSSLTSNSFVIENIDSQIAREENIIQNTTQVLSQMDEAINVLIEAQRIRGPEGAIAVREAQKSERESITSQIDQSNVRIQELLDRRTELSMQQAAVEAEVGPIRYVAELVYGPNPDKTLLEEAVRWLIILIVVVFDPLAITLVLASISGFRIRKELKKPKVELEEVKVEPIVAETPKVEPIVEEPKVVKETPKVVEEPEPASKSKTSGWMNQIQ